MQLMQAALAKLKQYGVDETMYQRAKDLRLKAKINAEENLWDALIIALKSIYSRDKIEFEVMASDKLIQISTRIRSIAPFGAQKINACLSQFTLVVKFA